MFASERGTPFTKRGFQAMVERAGEAAGFDMKIHPHMLRHASGFKLANDGVDTRTIQAYLGHKQSSIRCVTPSWHRLGSRACFETDRTMFGFEIRKGDPSFSSSKKLKYLSH